MVTGWVDKLDGGTVPVAAVTASIPPRRHALYRAMRSVAGQTAVPRWHSIAIDHDHQGAWATRHEALMAVPDEAEWVAFLDDDDYWGRRHLERCLAHAEATGADYVYPWFTVVGGSDPFPQHFGRPWDPEHPRQTTICTLVRRELAQRVGFHPVPEGRLFEGQRFGEDFQFTLDCAAAGARIVHLPERTWWWLHHGANTSGLPDRW